MAYRLLVPLDGSLVASWAIPWADELAGALQAEVELVHVAPPPRAGAAHPVSPSSYAADDTHTACTALIGVAEQFRQAEDVQTTTLIGPPGRRLAEHARATGADLIVMTSHGRYGLQRALLGSVAATVIRESGVPTWVIRGDLAAGPPSLPHRVLVPLDGSDLAASVLPPLLPLAQRLGWELIAMAVLERTDRWPVFRKSIPPQQIFADQRQDASAYLDRVVRALGVCAVAAEPLVRVGDPAQDIVEVARGVGADLIAISTHSRHGIDRLTAGSVTETVLAHADRPLLVVHPVAVRSGDTLSARVMEGAPTPAMAGARLRCSSNSP